MCGIVGVVGTQKNALDSVIEGLEQLEYRGYDSWGVAGIEANNSVFVEKRVGNVRLRDTKSFPGSSIAIGHTRWATHGGVSELNAHPHSDPSGRFVVVHNGVIENWKALKGSLHDSSHYVSETDTEVIAHLLGELSDSESLDERMLIVGKQLAGHNAFVVMDTQTRAVGAACFGSPLLLGRGTSGTWVASDVLAFDDSVIDYIALKPGQTTVLGMGVFESWLPVPPGAPRYKTTIPGQMMLDELLESPEVVRRGFETPLDVGVELIFQAKTVWLCGAGTAYHAALTGAYWLRQQGKAAFAFPASESHSWILLMKSTDLLILISQSGETRDTLTVVSDARPTQIKTLALVNRNQSTLTREVEQFIITPAGPEQAVLATKSLIAQLVLLWRLSHTEAVDHMSVVKSLKSLLTASKRNQIHKLACVFSPGKWTAILGEGCGWMMALETALKFKEGAYLPAEGMAGGELKHGTLALVEVGTTCLALNVDTQHEQALLQHLAEIRARGGKVIGISPSNNELFSQWITIPDLGSLMLIPGIIIAQLLTYEVALMRGINPDRPRNLAKSVTVE